MLSKNITNTILTIQLIYLFIKTKLKPKPPHRIKNEYQQFRKQIDPIKQKIKNEKTAGFYDLDSYITSKTYNKPVSPRLFSALDENPNLDLTYHLQSIPIDKQKIQSLLPENTPIIFSTEIPAHFNIINNTITNPPPITNFAQHVLFHETAHAIDLQTDTFQQPKEKYQKSTEAQDTLLQTLKKKNIDNNYTCLADNFSELEELIAYLTAEILTAKLTKKTKIQYTYQITSSIRKTNINFSTYLEIIKHCNKLSWEL